MTPGVLVALPETKLIYLLPYSLEYLFSFNSVHLFCRPEVCGMNCKLFCCHVMSGMKLLQSMNVLCVVPCDESVVVSGGFVLL